MRRIADGDEQAVGAMVDRWVSRLYSFTDGLRVSVGAADVAIEEVFRRLIFEAPRFVARPEKFNAWLQETVRNCVSATVARKTVAGSHRTGIRKGATMTEIQTVEGEACLALLRQQRVDDAMRYLNSLTQFRFTGIYRFDGMSVTNIRLFDRQSGFGSDGSVTPISSTFCLWINESLSVIQMTDSMSDPRAIGHPKREIVRSYCGGPICGEAGELIGTICHFDYDPREIPSEMLAILEVVGPSLASVVCASAA